MSEFLDQLQANEVLVALTLTAAIVTDLKYQKIFNKLTFPVMAVGIAWWIYQGQPWFGVVGLAVGFGMTFPAFALGRTLRAGDAKLMMAIGALLGPAINFRACLLMYVISIPFGLAVLAYKGRLGNLLPALRAGIGRARGEEVQAVQTTVVAYAPVIGVAVILACFTDWLNFWGPL
ncbi:MAG: prepilin peptidase CpaA [Cognaticolwellia sp.]